MERKANDSREKWVVTKFKLMTLPCPQCSWTLVGLPLAIGDLTSGSCFCRRIFYSCVCRISSAAELKGAFPSMRKDCRSLLLHEAQQGASPEDMLLGLVQWIVLWANFHFSEVPNAAVAALKLEREAVQIICAELVFPHTCYFDIVMRSQCSLQ